MTPLKVVLVSRFPTRLDRPLGGVEAATVALVAALCRFDTIDLHVVTLEPSRRACSVEPADGWTVHRLPGSPLPLVADLWIGPGRRRLLRYLLSLRPDLVHSHESYGLGLAALPMPHVMTVHGFTHLNLMANSARWAWLRAPIWKWVEQRGLASQRHVVSISPYVRQLLEPITTAEIHGIENPIDERFFDASESQAFERRDSVLCAGWLNERKNTLGAIDAFGAAVRSGAPGRLVIAGAAVDRSYRERIAARITELGLDDRVKVVGSLERGELLAEFGRARALLLISRQENAPMIIAEAMAAGVPVVASKRCGIPFMVRDGETGFLIDPDDPGRAGSYLARLLLEDDLTEAMGERARAEATVRFHPQRAARRTLELYRSLCPDRS